jgi:DNA-binding LytR/AlgR family response regulator
LEVLAKRQAPRIAFKVKGSILLLDLADILAVQAEGNYVSLQHRPSPYLVHESLSSMADKLKPYGFIRIHRSVVVNISAVEEIQPLPTGEYRLRVKDGKEYLVTRTYNTTSEIWLNCGWAQSGIGDNRGHICIVLISAPESHRRGLALMLQQ